MIWLYAVRWRLVFISAVIATTALRMTSAVKASTLLIYDPYRLERLERLKLLEQFSLCKPFQRFKRSSAVPSVDAALRSTRHQARNGAPAGESPHRSRVGPLPPTRSRIGRRRVRAQQGAQADSKIRRRRRS